MDTFPHELDRPSISGITEVLCGDPDALASSFIWEQTWQGHWYWSERFHAAAPLVDEDLNFLTTLMFFQIGKELADAHH